MFIGRECTTQASARKLQRRRVRATIQWEHLWNKVFSGAIVWKPHKDVFKRYQETACTSAAQWHILCHICISSQKQAIFPCDALRCGRSPVLALPVCTFLSNGHYNTFNAFVRCGGVLLWEIGICVHPCSSCKRLTWRSMPTTPVALTTSPRHVSSLQRCSCIIPRKRSKTYAILSLTVDIHKTTSSWMLTKCALKEKLTIK